MTEIIKYFEYDHLDDDLKAISKPCAELASYMDNEFYGGPEKLAGLRKLLEAKDCFVRAALQRRDG